MRLAIQSITWLAVISFVAAENGKSAYWLEQIPSKRICDLMNFLVVYIFCLQRLNHGFFFGELTMHNIAFLFATSKSTSVRSTQKDECVFAPF